MKIDLQPNENLIKESGANLQRGAETVGGKLFLTNDRLYFDTHSFNVATGSESIPLAQISEITLVWTKFLGVIPLFPNSMRVSTKDGKNYDFVVMDRSVWKSAIESEARIRV